ncbi:uncharacterized protein LOC119176747 [Rhipicephalus microplus]|uniref:uncharacterized protein LOC119176747 n=1 Tax=Rhipicephalus microplus TaxID=6941 RepID=UPI003F6A9EA6
MLTGSWRNGLVLVLLASLATGRRLGRAENEDDDEEEQPWMSDPGEIRRHRESKAVAVPPESPGPAGYSYDDQEQTPSRAECEVDSFRRGQSECDRILRMNLPHHHGSHDYVCYALRKYKMCVASVMIQSSCYERTFISQELHKIRGIIQGYSVDCFNITRETNRRGLKVRRLRFRMAKVKLSAECSPAAAWAVELTCTKDFETDMKALSQLNEPSRAVKKSCRTILRYYHCLTPVTESASCQKNPEFIKHLEYFPKAITARYKEVCLRELEISPSLFKEKVNTSMAAVLAKADNCKEEDASREFLACALVFNEVVTHTNDDYRKCEAYRNFIQCTNTIARTLNCGESSEFHHHAVHVLSVLLFNLQNKCKHFKRGRIGGEDTGATATNTSGAHKDGVRPNEGGPHLPDNIPDARPAEPKSTPPEHEGGPTRRRFFKNTDQAFKETTENPFYPPLRKMPLEPRIPQADDYPRSHDDDDSSASERKRPGRHRNNDDHPSRESMRGRHARKGGAHHDDGSNERGRNSGDERNRNSADERHRNSAEERDRNGAEERDKNSGEKHNRNSGEEHNRNIGEEHNRKLGEEHNRNIGEEHNRNIGEEHIRNIGEEHNRNIGEEHIRNIGEEHNRNIGEEHIRNSGDERDRSSDEERDRSSDEEHDRSSVEGNVRKGGFKGGRREGRRHRPHSWGARRIDQDKNDGYPADPNYGFLEDSEPEGMDERKKRLSELL